MFISQSCCAVHSHYLKSTWSSLFCKPYDIMMIIASLFLCYSQAWYAHTVQHGAVSPVDRFPVSVATTINSLHPSSFQSPAITVRYLRLLWCHLLLCCRPNELGECLNKQSSAACQESQRARQKWSDKPQDSEHKKDDDERQRWLQSMQRVVEALKEVWPGILSERVWLCLELSLGALSKVSLSTQSDCTICEL